MKKMISLFLALAACMALCVAPASAADCDSSMSDMATIHLQVDEATLENATRASTVFDLSDGNYDVDNTIRADGGTYRSSLLKTNTQKIYVMLYCYPRSSLTIELLDSSGNSLQEVTTTVCPDPQEYSTISFKNLTSSKNYRVRVTNNGQSDCTITGIIKDSLFFSNNIVEGDAQILAQ